MTKITLAIVGAAIAATTMFSQAAQACISCNYVPEVIAAGEKKAKRKQYVARPAKKKHIAKVPVRKAPKKVHVAKTPAPKKVDVAKAAPSKPIEAAKPAEVAKADPVPVEQTAKTDAEVETEATESPISTAALIDAGGVVPTDEVPEVDNASNCKKFFPAVGMTLTVPCE